MSFSVLDIAVVGAAGISPPVAKTVANAVSTMSAKLANVPDERLSEKLITLTRSTSKLLQVAQADDITAPVAGQGIAGERSL